MKQLLGWWFPDADFECGPAAVQQVEHIDRWLPYIPRRGVAVQAGGNCGLFPQRLAKHFRAVYTFEPDHENFACLVRNVTAGNVVKMQAGLADAPAFMGLHRFAGNAGAHYLEGEGLLPVLTVDSLNLPACDLLAFDIEGAEFAALRGAQETIRAYRPTIVFEDKAHGVRFGDTREGLYAWLRSHGYAPREKVHRDAIWT